MHPSRRKGIKAELEVAALISDELGFKVRRRYNLGTHEDIGDIVIEDHTIQVAAYKDLARAIREKVPACVEQQERAQTTFGATFLRLTGGKYVVVLTPSQWATYARESA